MRFCKIMSWSAVAGGIALASLGACHGEPPTEGPTATVALAITVPPDFSGVSVHILGTRDQPANGIYGCASTLDGCFSLDPDGFATSTSTGAPGFDGLCPSDDAPVGDWTFTYTFYDGSDCTGTVLNDGDHDLVCYAAADIGRRAHPNETYEEVISEGVNENDIFCLTTPATKTFNFTVCDVLDGDPDEPGPLILDCACTPCSIPGMQCLCPGYYGAQPALPAGCDFDNACNVVCGP